MNELFSNALKRVPQNTPPIWFMRQAGRYHSHYQSLRAKHSFMDLCKKPELAAEVALGPVLDFDYDVSILFSDLLFPLEALGMGLHYPEATGPHLDWYLSDVSSLSKLRSPNEAIAALEFQRDAVKHTRERLPKHKSLIGFVGSPWTLFAYAVQGSHAGSLTNSKEKLHLFDSFCESLVPLLIQNIELQFQGGAEIVMLFDTAAGELSPQIYLSKVVPQLEKLVEKYPNRLGYYSKWTTDDHFAHPFFKNQFSLAGVGVDHRFQLSSYFQKTPKGFVQGNFDQSLLFLEESHFEKALKSYLEPFKNLPPEKRAGWVCGLGHGVLPKTPEKNVKAFIEITRRTFS